jgi:hypothetical protein
MAVACELALSSVTVQWCQELASPEKPVEVQVGELTRPRLKWKESAAAVQAEM